MARRGCGRCGLLWAALLVLAVLIAPSVQPGSSLDLRAPSSAAAPVAGIQPPSQAAPAAGRHAPGQSLNRTALSESLKATLKKLDKSLLKSADAKIEAAAEGLLSALKQQKKEKDNSHPPKEMAGMEKVESLIEAKLEAMVAAIEANITKEMWLSAERQMDQKLDKRVVTKLESAMKKGSFDLPKVQRASPAVVAAGKPAKLDSGAGQHPDQAQKEAPTAVAGKAAAEVAEKAAPASEPAAPTCKATDVTAAPKDWCGRSEKKPCMDNWESQYMMKHADKLSEGLQTLRSASCFPRGRSFAAMGYYRTGSTLLYNTARLWAALGAGDSLVAGFMCKDPEKMGIGMPGAQVEKCTSVCKDHTWHTGNPEHTDVILMSRRDPFKSVCSRKLMGQWCKMPPASGKKEAPTPAEAEAYSKKCLKVAEIEKQETITQCHDLMKMQAAIYYERVILGRLVAYDVLMEDYEEDPAKEVQAVGLAMGICDQAATNPGLVEFIVKMGKQLKQNPSADMGITQMHDVHTTSQREAQCDKLEAFMRSDDECRAWMDAKAAVTANAELERMKADPPKRQRLGSAPKR